MIDVECYAPLMVEAWRPSDRDGAISVVQEVFDEYGFTWEPEGYHQDLYDVPGTYLECGDEFFVYRNAGLVVGTVALECFPTLPGPFGSVIPYEGMSRLGGTDCSLQRLYVSQGSRKLGVGRALFSKAIVTARERGCQAMEIWSDKLFNDAHRLYLKLGAKIVGERVCDDPDQSKEWGLVLDLEQAIL